MAVEMGIRRMAPAMDRNATEPRTPRRISSLGLAPLDQAFPAAVNPEKDHDPEAEPVKGDVPDPEGRADDFDDARP